MIVARAPFRLTLGGGGTDLPSYYERHGGFVLAAAIDKYLYIGVNRPSADDLLRLKYSRYEEVADVEDLEHDLVRPALKHLGLTTNLEIVSLADVPAGTGLGSSSTYLVALLTALDAVTGEQVSPQVLAELAFHIEADLAGHPVGKQDQYLAALGGITRLEIGQDGSVQASPLAISTETADELRARLLLFFTNASRSANTILQAQQRETARGDDGVVSSLHETKRIGREICDALEQGEVDTLGRLMHEHWEVKKRRSELISSAEIDRLYETAREAGALGGKIVGAGGGGFLLVYSPASAKGDVCAALGEHGLKEVPYQFDFEGAKVVMSL